MIFFKVKNRYWVAGTYLTMVRTNLLEMYPPYTFRRPWDMRTGPHHVFKIPGLYLREISEFYEVFPLQIRIDLNSKIF